MKLLLCSDPHIDAVTSGVPRFDDIAKALDETVEAAVREKVDLWCCLGDWCNPDTTRAFRAASHAITVARQLSNAGIESLWIAGNHDVIEDGSGTTTLSPLQAATIGASVYERPGYTVFEYHEVAVWALPYTARAGNYDPDKFIRDYANDAAKGYRNVVLGHLMLDGIHPGSETRDMSRGRDLYWPMQAIRDCLPGALVFGGHYHQRQEFGGVQIVGSVARLRHDEEEHRPGYLIVEV